MTKPTWPRQASRRRWPSHAKPSRAFTLTLCRMTAEGWMVIEKSEGNYYILSLPEDGRTVRLNFDGKLV